VSRIEGHNLIYADQRVQQYHTVLGRRVFRRIADIGCGLGFTTQALTRRYPQARVVGIDVSADAVEYGRRTVADAEFVQMPIDPSGSLPGRFDLILCQEFYPFTRTGEAETHRAFVDLFRAHLEPGGVLMIELSERDRDRTILATLDRQDWTVERHWLPFDRLYRSLPLFTPMVLASHVLARLLRRERNLCLLIRA
jgi:trans-aconitate methyltransferase